MEKPNNDIENHPASCGSHRGFACDCLFEGKYGMSKAGKKILAGLDDALAFAKGDKKRARIISPDKFFDGLNKKRAKDQKRVKPIKESKMANTDTNAQKAKSKKLTDREAMETEVRTDIVLALIDKKGSVQTVDEILSQARTISNYILGE